LAFKLWTAPPEGILMRIHSGLRSSLAVAIILTLSAPRWGSLVEFLKEVFIFLRE
jgi:hypothetical protein